MTRRDGDGTEPHSIQENIASGGGTIYAHQGKGDQIIHVAPVPPAPPKRRLRADTVVLLILLPADVAFFFYGMLSYTGANTSAELRRALIFIAMLIVTAGMVRRWLRRRL